MTPFHAKILDFAPLSNTLKHSRTAVSYDKQERIFSRGDRGDSVLLLKQGCVKLSLTSEEGKEAIVSVRDTGHLIGESSLASRPSSRSTDAIALTDVDALRLERGAFLTLIHKDSAVYDAVLSFLI